jgi:hypothetical protein
MIREGCLWWCFWGWGGVWFFPHGNDAIIVILLGKVIRKEMEWRKLLNIICDIFSTRLNFLYIPLRKRISQCFSHTLLLAVDVLSMLHTNPMRSANVSTSASDASSGRDGKQLEAWSYLADLPMPFY